MLSQLSIQEKGYKPSLLRDVYLDLMNWLIRLMFAHTQLEQSYKRKRPALLNLKECNIVMCKTFRGSQSIRSCKNCLRSQILAVKLYMAYPFG